MTLRLMLFLAVLFLPLSQSQAELVKPLTLSWEGVPEAKGYFVEVSPNKNFKSHVVRKKVFKNSYEWQKPQNGEFFWRVTPFDEDIELGQVSETRTIKISVKKPPAPAPSSGVGNADLTSSSAEAGASAVSSSSAAAVEVSAPVGPRFSIRHARGYFTYVQNALGSVNSGAAEWTPRLRMFARHHLVLSTRFSVLRSVAGSLFPVAGVSLVPQWRVMDLFEFGLGAGMQNWFSELGGSAMTMHAVLEVHTNFKILKIDVHPIVSLSVIDGGRTAGQFDVGLAF